MDLESIRSVRRSSAGVVLADWVARVAPLNNNGIYGGNGGTGGAGGDLTVRFDGTFGAGSKQAVRATHDSVGGTGGAGGQNSIFGGYGKKRALEARAEPAAR